MKVYITHPIPENGIAMLKAKGYEIVDSAQDADAVISQLNDPINKAFFEATPNLKIVANYAVGYNNIDLEAASARGIFVTNTPEVLTNTTAEYTVALMFAIMRRVAEADHYVRAGKFVGFDSDLLLGTDLMGKTLGIIGAGRIGSRVGEIAKAIGMTVIMEGPDDKPEEILPKCDVVSLHVPLLDSTKHLINETRLALMKPTAYLINTSRGPVVDEAALVQALKNGTIRGAALDVYEFEPKVHPDLLQLENVVLSPHIASGSEETRIKMSEVVALNVIEALEGRIPPNLAK